MAGSISKRRGLGGPGLTMRDKFAMAALVSVTGDRELMRRLNSGRVSVTSRQRFIATSAYKIADEMMKARRSNG